MLPGRRPRSRSLTNAGPPTAQNTRFAPPKSDVALRVPGVRAELARGEGDELLDLRRGPSGPCASRDRRTRPPRPSTSSARSPRTCIPISDRIRSDAAWIDSTSSADRISIGRYGLTRRRHGTWRTPPAARRARRWTACSLARAHARDATTPLRILRRVSASAAWMSVYGWAVHPASEASGNAMRRKILALVVLAAVGVGAVAVSVGARRRAAGSGRRLPHDPSQRRRRHRRGGGHRDPRRGDDLWPRLRRGAVPRERRRPGACI